MPMHPPEKRGRLAYSQFYAAMEAGLIRDILFVTPQVPCVKIYQDLSGRKHRIFHCNHPNNLKDLLTRDKALKQSIGYPEGRPHILLDIDLDFFTYYDENQDETHAISEENFKSIFSNDSLIWWISEKARLITISKEPFWCGGIDNSEHIFKLLKTFFLNKIETRNTTPNCNKRMYTTTRHF